MPGIMAVLSGIISYRTLLYHHASLNIVYYCYTSGITQTSGMGSFHEKHIISDPWIMKTDFITTKSGISYVLVYKIWYFRAFKVFNEKTDKYGQGGYLQNR